MIKCVCLVEETKDQILLVQVRHREKYYFPGGKIDEGETQLEALIRELKEELNLHLSDSELSYIGTVVGEAYPQENMLTELNGYRATTAINWDNIHTDNEITDIKWINKDNVDMIAPAVLKWINEMSAE
ncbi:NUDIX domain-containing protein [Staphylococcus pasteuri]|nr:MULTISPECIES: NUDIX domain-containing protein [Staphylococcus]ODB81992.1 DNA mismatch repair protein MutT [Staphylococcus sp. AOAB]RQX28083.1 NUDIX domain-containing protein [Staphylococcus warneri]MCO0861773.1 NUDIX domain-containing protein [Staphylococcus pasteuri]MCO5359785.1 NUDIX domain-containing protein [Staphylococcus pasteuri]OFV12611.1 DNA mismatch repair protein MutT [Staphylococcus sp. HMSC13A10]